MDATMGSQFAYHTPSHGGPVNCASMESALHYQSCNHGDILTESILQMFRNGDLFDVIVVAGPLRIQAHRLVLAACSSYFRDLLNSVPPPPAHLGSKMDAKMIPEIEIADVDGESALKVIEFCYTAAISVNEENVWGILPVACMFQMEEVCQVCCDFLESRLSVATCLPTLRLALKCSCQDLQAKAANFIRKHFDELVGERDFQEMDLDSMLDQLKCLQLDVISDRQLVRGLRAWVGVKPDVRKQAARQIGSHFPDLISQMKDFLPQDLFRPVEEESAARASPSKLEDSPRTSTTTSDYSTDHESGPMAPICRICGEVFASPEDLSPHLAECSKTLLGSHAPYADPASLLERMGYPPFQPRGDNSITGASTGVAVAPGLVAVSCPVCHKSFPERKNLAKHMKVHADNGFMCQICGKRFSTRSNLQGHMRVHGAAGERAKLYQCEDCDESFDSFCTLKVHRRSHTSLRPFPCPTCGVSFAKNIHLKRHLAIHTGIKPHQCRICQKFFSRSDHLKRHIQSIHSGAKPHSCHLCQKNFVRKYELNKHIRQHYDNTLPDSGPSSPASSLANDSYVAASPRGSESYSTASPFMVKVEASQD